VKGRRCATGSPAALMSWLPILAARRPGHGRRRPTVALGAGPWRGEIELLAQRGRLRLEGPVDMTASPEVPPSPAASLGLTPREVEVLALIAEGRTNRQIG
jgi:hypothetical protein